MAHLPVYSWRSYHPDVELHYITDVDHADLHLAALAGPVGFDLEWKPTFVKGAPENPVALIQLANSHSILLIHISSMPRFPEKLRDFLENPRFAKAGVAIQNDVKKLYKDCQVSTRNCVDLSLLARSVDNAQWKGRYNNPLGLARLVEAYENLRLPKGKVSRSNWELPLSSQQTEYAGNDAHAGFIVYHRLIAMAQSMVKIPDPIYYSFDALGGRLCQPSGLQWNSHNPDYDPGPSPPPKRPTAGPSTDHSRDYLHPQTTRQDASPSHIMSNPSHLPTHSSPRAQQVLTSLTHQAHTRHPYGLSSVKPEQLDSERGLSYIPGSLNTDLGRQAIPTRRGLRNYRYSRRQRLPEQDADLAA